MSAPGTQVLTHAQKVTRLYRKSLKNLLSWTIIRQVWREEAVELRAVFDEHKHVDMAEATKLLQKGEELYQRHIHPDPYIREC
jgi:NADH dehydrogenase (ubiquinone) 1 beta subcomplex subunit 9